MHALADLAPPLPAAALEAALHPGARRLAIALQEHGPDVSPDVRDSLTILQGLIDGPQSGGALAPEAAFLIAAILDPSTGLHGVQPALHGPVDDLLHLLTPAGFMAPYELASGSYGIWG